jgi:ribosomal-protein-alanine N-acetyltransferase
MFNDLYIETERLVLRCFRMDDLPAFLALVGQPEVMEYLPEDVMKLEEARDTLNWIIESYGVNTPDQIRKFTVAVARNRSNEIIGWCGLGPLEFDPERIELYYGISYPDWGKGYATEAARAMLRYGFEMVGLREIVAVVNRENLASKRVLEKLGMPYRREVRNLKPEHKTYEGHLFYSLEYREAR